MLMTVKVAIGDGWMLTTKRGNDDGTNRGDCGPNWKEIGIILYIIVYLIKRV